MMRRSPNTAAIPRARCPGTKMLYNGVKNAGQLADLVAYLKEATK